MRCLLGLFHSVASRNGGTWKERYNCIYDLVTLSVSLVTVTLEPLNVYWATIHLSSASLPRSRCTALIHLSFALMPFAFLSLRSCSITSNPNTLKHQMSQEHEFTVQHAYRKCFTTSEPAFLWSWYT
jgi:hypothetical protein